MFERAVQHDPGFVDAHAALSLAHLTLYWDGWGAHDKSPERLEMALETATRALELNPDSPHGHKALGYYHYWGHRDYEQALEEFATAAASLPNDSEIAAGVGFVWRRQGQFDEAIEQMRKALDLDPRDAVLANDLADTYRVLSAFPDADRYYDLAISLAPRQARAYQEKAGGYLARGLLDRARATLDAMPRANVHYYFRAWVQLERFERNYHAALERLASASEEAFPAGEAGWKKGGLYRLMNQPEQARTSYEAARVVLERAVKDRPDDWLARGFLGIAYAGLGRKAEAIREAKRAVELLPVSKDAYAGTIPRLRLAVVYTMVGEDEAALDQIEYLLSIPSYMTVWNLRLDPTWDPLRDNPRFQKLVGEDWQAEVSP
jgi:serine/threonine-protein kinase